MLRRFLLGLIEGLVIGLAVGVAGVRGLGLGTPSALVAAALAGAVGFLVGLVAGRPVWARDAKTEALLKASIGALVGAGLSLALGHWLRAPVDLSPFELGTGPAGKLLALNLPAIACALALFFELDDTGSRGSGTRLSASPGKQRLASPTDELVELDELSDEAARKVEKR